MPHPPQSFIDHDGNRLLGSPRPPSSDLTLPHDAGLNRPTIAESSMSIGMVRMDLTRRLNAHRTLSLTVSFLALVGWGAFASSAGSSASAERDLRAALAQSQFAQDQLRAERDQQQAAVGDLTQIQAQLVSARRELETLAQRRERAAAQDDKQAKVSEKGSVREAKPSGNQAQVAAQGKGEKA